MKVYVRDMARRKVSDFIRLEHGKVGNRSMLTAAALVSASSLAALLLAPTSAQAGGYCGSPNLWCEDPTPYCCYTPFPFDRYSCDDNGDMGPGWTCYGPL